VAIIDPNQNWSRWAGQYLSGLFGRILVVGSLSRPRWHWPAARSQLAKLVAAVFVSDTGVLTPLFRTCTADAAAIVIAAMLHLTKPVTLRDLFVRSPWSF